MLDATDEPSTTPSSREPTMGSKDKGGREAKKPKANKKPKGQTPAPRSNAVEAIQHGTHPPEK
jgi:hypothetical protein